MWREMRKGDNCTGCFDFSQLVDQTVDNYLFAIFILEAVKLLQK